MRGPEITHSPLPSQNSADGSSPQHVLLIRWFLGLLEELTKRMGLPWQGRLGCAPLKGTRHQRVPPPVSQRQGSLSQTGIQAGGWKLPFSSLKLLRKLRRGSI